MRTRAFIFHCNNYLFLMKIMGFEMEKCSVAASEVDDSIGIFVQGLILKSILLSLMSVLKAFI